MIKIAEDILEDFYRALPAGLRQINRHCWTAKQAALNTASFKAAVLSHTD